MRVGFLTIELEVAREAAWECLVDKGRRDWYYRLTPEGEFAEGAHIRWVDGRGDLIEESDVVEVDPPSHLVMRTHFLFAPSFAAAPPHVIKWEITSSDSGCQVRMSWEAEDAVARLFESEGDSQLQGLRLAADPAARIGLERLREIGDVEIRDVTPELLPEYLRFFDDYAFAITPRGRAVTAWRRIAPDLTKNGPSAPPATTGAT